MVAYYDEIEIEDMTWDEEKRLYHYPCPCGDRFEISKKQLSIGEDVATCPSCSLIIRVIYDYMDFEKYECEDEGEIVKLPSNPTLATPAQIPIAVA